MQAFSVEKIKHSELQKDMMLTLTSSCNHINFKVDFDTELTGFIYLKKSVHLCLV